ncbi:unnamed protein product [Gongylonema pulchrum]|uniref:Homeotic protein antennapedia n=1 Tax=Gongylonema pulchrum TaxID=637853 RepID=A0A183D771_9BILA|nr:unnamed protein product [Gongylonema pulchrum]
MSKNGTNNPNRQGGGISDDEEMEDNSPANEVPASSAPQQPQQQPPQQPPQPQQQPQQQRQQQQLQQQNATSPVLDHTGWPALQLGGAHPGMPGGALPSMVPLQQQQQQPAGMPSFEKYCEQSEMKAYMYDPMAGYQWQQPGAAYMQPPNYYSSI